MLREDHFLYVDKTAQLEKLIAMGQRYFLSRQHGFGKSLLLSTLAAMFSGKADLFQGLAAEALVRDLAQKPYAVLSFDLANLDTENVTTCQASFQQILDNTANIFGFPSKAGSFKLKLTNLLYDIFKNNGQLVILIDNFDTPIVECINQPQKLLRIHKLLKVFYDSLNKASRYIKFLMIVGQEKYNNTGIFSTINDLNDISNDKQLARLVGFTESEMQKTFSAWISLTAQSLPTENHTILEKLRAEVVAQGFEPTNYVYNSAFVLQCLSKQTLHKYFSYLQANTSHAIHPYTCINQGDRPFLEVRNFQIYVDKSELLIHTNQFIETEHKYICISRPRRFGKTLSAKMVAAYYDRTGSAETAFKNLKITKHHSFNVFANKYIVIQITIQTYLSKSKNINKLIQNIQKDIILDLAKQYDNINISDDINNIMKLVAQTTGQKFVIVIDEWDCLFRELREQEAWQKQYLDFLRSWLKDQDHIALVYMTGILPIKKYGTHSALNMFDEYSMLAAAPFTEFVGFTEAEVQELCQELHRDFDECKKWYDGYQIDNYTAIYNPRSVSSYLSSGIVKTYWNNTESYEALRMYITMKKYGLRETMTKLLANSAVPVRTGAFANDMKTFHSHDDVLTLLVHLGYLSYDATQASVRIPNKEIAEEFVSAMQNGDWPIVIKAIDNSQQLLAAVLKLEAETVASGVEAAHQEMSHLQYNDENALAYTISLAFYAAREQYTMVREFPAGKGFADLVFLPRPHCPWPILLIELKWDKTAKAGIEQIRARQYPASLAEHAGKVLLVGINYSKKSKKHSCSIEAWQL